MGRTAPEGDGRVFDFLSVAHGGSKPSRDNLRQDHCFHTGASVPEKDEGVVYIYGHRPASDIEGIDKKPLPKSAKR
ncbi:hypothetical protein [Bacillus sp. FJAT-42315]|uniref:hypothetical protein n=1 Tax=Bacillus sp. FJAT-42315 TaxID=2014077 RepID=UPI000C2488B3|nr:hypothetical protein [Bacillus sp. FJAT-42315]